MIVEGRENLSGVVHQIDWLNQLIDDNQTKSSNDLREASNLL